MRLAGSAVADCDNVFATGRVLGTGEFQDEGLVERKEIAAKSKLSTLLTAGNRASLIRRSTMREWRTFEQVREEGPMLLVLEDR